MQDRRSESSSNGNFLARRQRLWGPVFSVLGLCLLHVLAASFYRLQAVSQNPICNQYLLAVDLVPVIGPESSREFVSFTFDSPAPYGDIPLEINSANATDASFIEAPGACFVRTEQSSVDVRVSKHPQTPRQLEFLVRSQDPRARFRHKNFPEARPQTELILTALLSKALNPAPLPPLALPPAEPAPLPSVRMTGSPGPIRGDVVTVTISANNLNGEVLQVTLVPPEPLFTPVTPLSLTASEPLSRVDLRLIPGTEKPRGVFEVRAAVTGARSDLIVPPLKLEFYHRQWPNQTAAVRLLLVDTEFAPAPLAESIAQIVAAHHAHLADDGVVLIRPGKTVVVRNGESLNTAGPEAFTGDHWKDAFSAIAAELDGGHRAIVVWPSPMLPTAGAAPLKALSHIDLLWCNGPDISAPQVNTLITDHIGAWWRVAEEPNLTDINTEMAPGRLKEVIEKILVGK